MLRDARIILPVVALVVVGGLALSSQSAPLSLASDVGLTEAEVCDAVSATGQQSVQRLLEAGFPHASLDQVETYRLVRMGVVEAVVQIDWTLQAAHCLPLDYDGPATAELHMKPAAYAALVGELKSVLDSGTVSWSVGNWFALTMGSSVIIPQNPEYEAEYERRVALWAAGCLAGAD